MPVALGVSLEAQGPQGWPSPFLPFLSADLGRKRARPGGRSLLVAPSEPRISRCHAWTALRTEKRKSVALGFFSTSGEFVQKTPTPQPQDSADGILQSGHREGVPGRSGQPWGGGCYLRRGGAAEAVCPPEGRGQWSCGRWPPGGPHFCPVL